MKVVKYSRYNICSLRFGWVRYIVVRWKGFIRSLNFSYPIDLLTAYGDGNCIDLSKIKLRTVNHVKNGNVFKWQWIVLGCKIRPLIKKYSVY